MVNDTLQLSVQMSIYLYRSFKYLDSVKNPQRYAVVKCDIPLGRRSISCALFHFQHHDHTDDIYGFFELGHSKVLMLVLVENKQYLFIFWGPSGVSALQLPK